MSIKSSAFLETLIAFLMPYFSAAESDSNDARTEIIETLAAYATRTRAELLQAAQIIALGMTTLDCLAESRTAEMSPSTRIRFRGCANGMNRATLNTEKSLQKSLACSLDEAPADPGTESKPAQSLPVVDLRRNSGSTANHRPTVRREQSNQFWAAGMMQAIEQMGLPAHIAPNG